MAIPAQVATPFIMTKAERFIGLEVFLHVPASADRLNQEAERGVRWGPDEEKGQFARVIETATQQKPASTIDLTSESDGQASSVKQTMLCAQTLKGEMPACRFVNGCDIAQQQLPAVWRDGFGGRNSQDVGVAVCLKPLS